MNAMTSFVITLFFYQKKDVKGEGDVGDDEEQVGQNCFIIFMSQRFLDLLFIAYSRILSDISEPFPTFENSLVTC